MRNLRNIHHRPPVWFDHRVLQRIAALLMLCTGGAVLAAAGKPIDYAANAARSFELFWPNVQIFLAINSYRSPLLDTLCYAITSWEIGYYLIPTLPLVWLWRPKKILPLLLAVAIETFVVQALKHIFDQPRPGLLLPQAHLLAGREIYHHSFPSGDAAFAAVVVTAICWGERNRWWWLLWIVPLCIAYERMYIGVHFPLDVAVGLMIGALSAVLVYRVWLRKDARCLAVWRSAGVLARRAPAGSDNHTADCESLSVP